jgi:hypothetical protein
VRLVVSAISALRPRSVVTLRRLPRALSSTTAGATVVAVADFFRKIFTECIYDRVKSEYSSSLHLIEALGTRRGVTNFFEIFQNLVESLPDENQLQGIASRMRDSQYHMEDDRPSDEFLSIKFDTLKEYPYLFRMVTGMETIQWTRLSPSELITMVDEHTNLTELRTYLEKMFEELPYFREMMADLDPSRNDVMEPIQIDNEVFFVELEQLILEMDEMRREHISIDETPVNDDAAAAAASVVETRWGDYSSDEDYTGAFTKLTVTPDISKEISGSIIEIPMDLKNYCPDLHEAIRLWVSKRTNHGFVLREDTSTSMRGESYKYGKLDSSNLPTELAKMNSLDRIALESFFKLFATLQISPSYLLRTNSQDSAGAYVLNLIFNYIHKDAGDQKKYINISLKNGDAGERLLKSRFYNLFLTGSGCANMMWRSFHVMLNFMIKNELKREEALVMLTEYEKTCFTTLPGMLNNSYKTVMKVEERTVETQLKGKTKITKQVVRRPGKDVPKLNLSRAPIDVSEMESLSILISDFNNLEDVAQKVCERITSVDILRKAKVCSVVSEMAYAKISTLRKIFRIRKDAIRQQLAENGAKKVTAAAWLVAKNQVLEKIPRIDVNDLNLRWDIDVVSQRATLLMKT